MRTLILLAAAVVGLPFLGSLVGDAAAQSQANLSFEAQWARPTPPSARTGAVYGVIRNSGSNPDRLIGASSPVAERIEMHETAIEGDIARMRPVASVPVPAASMVPIQPGGLHLMLVNLTSQLRLDQSFPITLRFASGTEVTTDVPIMTGSRSVPHGGH